MANAALNSRQEALAAAAERCSGAGEQLTPLRRRVLELLLEQAGPVKAYDLLESLRREHAAAKPPTIYRALDFLVRLGLAHRVESQNAFMACAGGHGHAPALVLVCARCGSALEIPALGLAGLAASAAAAAGFTLERLMIEATGVCASCAGAP